MGKSSTKQKITLRDLATAYNTLKNVNIVNEPIFNYVLAKNLLVLENEYKPIEEAMKPSKEFQQFLERMDEIKQVYRNDSEKLEGAILKLKSEYKKVLEDRKKQMDELEDMLSKKSVNITIQTIDKKDIPENIGTQVFKAMIQIGMII